MVFIKAQVGPSNVGDPESMFRVHCFDEQGNLTIWIGEGHFYCTQSNTFSASKSLLQMALEKIESEQFFAAHKNDDGSTTDNSASVSGGYDFDGNAHLEGRISHDTWDQEGNSSSFELKGEVSRDKEGNTNSEVKAEATWHW